MPRGKQIEVKTRSKSGLGSVKKSRKPEINQAEAERIKVMLEEEEAVIEADLRHEMSRMISEQDVKMSRQLGDMNGRNKRWIMWIGVSLSMLVIVAFWVSTLDFQVNRNYTESSKQIDPKSLAEYKDNLDKTFKEIMTQIDQLKEQSKQAGDGQMVSSTTTTEPIIN